MLREINMRHPQENIASVPRKEWTKGHIAVDLDGTLAHYTEWVAVDSIGKPIPKMLERVRRWIDNKQRVVIFTARADPTRGDYQKAITAIKAWCMEHLGYVLPITNCKTIETLEIWDDRAVQVIHNTGTAIDNNYEYRIEQ